LFCVAAEEGQGELENQLEQEQEALVNRLWKRMDKLEAEKRSFSFLFILFIYKKTIYKVSLGRHFRGSISSPAVAETISGTHCTYPLKDGQAEWA